MRVGTRKHALPSVLAFLLPWLSLEGVSRLWQQ